MTKSTSLFVPDALLLDLDDTILSFNEGSEDAWAIIASRFCEEWRPPFDERALYEKILVCRDWYWSDPDRHKTGREEINHARREIMRNTLAELAFPHQEAGDAAADEYSRIRWDSMHLFEGSLEALDKFRSLGIRLALLTNGGSRIQREKLRRFGLESYFSEILIDQETGVSKPDPAVFHLAVERLGVSSDRAMMVGDNLDWDVRGAQAAGLFAVWNDYLRKGLPENPVAVPDAEVRTILELAEMFEEIRRSPQI